jgi:hypothetical protein
MRLWPVIGAPLGVVLLGLAGCASPVQLTLADTPVSTVPGTKPSSDALPLTFAPTVDLRPEYQRKGVGHVGGREVLADELLSWIDRALQSMHGHRFVASRETTAATWRVIPRLRQFYTASLAVSKNANVVLELEIQPPGAPGFTRVYRGRVNAMNWWNSSAEIEGTVVDSLGDCLEHIVCDLDSLVPPDSSRPTTGRDGPNAKTAGLKP